MLASIVRVLALTAAVTAMPQPVAQTAASVPRVAYFGPGPQPGAAGAPPLLEVLREELARRGLVDGRDIVIDSRWPEGGHLDRLPQVVAELVSRKPHVIVAVGATAARAATEATATIPIVFEVVVDPVATGLVRDRARPGGNATGFTSFDPQQSVKQLQLLKEALPGIRRVALLGDAGAAASLIQVNEDAARSAGLEFSVHKVERIPNPDFAGALEAAKREGAQAVVVISTPVTTPHRKIIVELAAKQQLPTLSPRDHEDAAPLMSYGTTFLESTRRAAGYVDRILKGAKPGELGVETVSEPELIFNLKTARVIGVTVPEAVLSRATRIVD